MKPQVFQHTVNTKVLRGKRMAAEIRGRSLSALAYANKRADRVITEGRNLLKPLPADPADPSHEEVNQ